MNTVFRIQGGVPLKGTVKISGSKNAALPMLAASLLCSKPITLTNVPDIEDIRVICEILIKLGCEVTRSENKITVDSSKLNHHLIDPELAYKLRGSVLLIAPLLIRLQQVVFAVPGGCVIGDRPIDVHLDTLKSLGATITKGKTSYTIRASKLKPATITLREMSVTGTSTAIMAAIGAVGKTTIQLAAVEPETFALIEMLQAMGARIEGKGTTTLVITGGRKLECKTFKVIPDRIEAGTFAAAAVATKGDIIIDGYVANDLLLVTKKLEQMGAKLTHISPTRLRVQGAQKLKSFKIQTNIYPNFPTDLQAIFGALAILCEGDSEIFEIMYDHRLGYLTELKKMGAKYKLTNPHQALIYGSQGLKPAKVVAQDIRAGAAVLIAALAIPGVSTISSIGLIDRGYEAIEGKLSSLGAKITRVAL